MKDKKSLFPIWALGAFTWFGYHCGSGFASGTQVKAYVLKYGAMGILAPVVAWIVCAAFIYIIAEYARCVKAKSYKDVAASIYWPNESFGRFVIIVWDAMVLLSSIVASSSCVAGAGALLQNLCGAPYWMGCALFVVVMLLLLSVGEGALKRLGNISSCMIFLVLFICLVGIVQGASHLSEVFGGAAGAPVAEGTTLGKILNSGFTYGCIQISFLHTACVVGGGFGERSDTAKFVTLGFLMNCGVMLVESVCLFGFYPAFMDSNMPMLNVVQGTPGVLGLILMVMYNFVLVMAYLTTAGAVITGQIARYRGLVGKAVKNEFVCKLVIVLFFLMCSSALSVLGLEGIVTKAYGFLANLRKPIWFFPLLILGPVNIRRVRMAKKEIAE